MATNVYTMLFYFIFLSLQLIILDFKVCLWRKDSSLVAVVNSAGVPGSSPAAVEIFLGVHMQSPKLFKFVV